MACPEQNSVRSSKQSVWCCHKRNFNDCHVTFALNNNSSPGRQMRYTVQFQNPTGHWVVYDNQSFTMLGSFRTEDDARVAARRFEERAPPRRIKMSSPKVA